MVTGSRGIHVVCPLRRAESFGTVHSFARALAEAMVAEDPKRLTLEWHRSERGRRIYLDVNRINYAQHVVAPYGVRAKPRAPVAMPIRWDELADPRLRPDGWTVANAAARVESDGDAWKGIAQRARKLPVKHRSLRQLVEDFTTLRAGMLFAWRKTPSPATELQPRRPRRGRPAPVGTSTTLQCCAAFTASALWLFRDRERS